LAGKNQKPGRSFTVMIMTIDTVTVLTRTTGEPRTIIADDHGLRRAAEKAGKKAFRYILLTTVSF
jgi:hypothetical protein